MYQSNIDVQYFIVVTKLGTTTLFGPLKKYFENLLKHYFESRKKENDEWWMATTGTLEYE